MKQRSYIIGSLIVLITVSIFLFPDKIEVPKQEQTETTLTTSRRTEGSINPRGVAKMPARSVASITTDELKNLRGTLPDKQDVIAETGKDPHRTPESLLNFAQAMGPLMEKAYKNVDDADLLITELHACALDETVAESARALCVSNTDKIARTYPQMRGKAGELRAKVSPEVMNLLKKKNLLLKK